MRARCWAIRVALALETSATATWTSSCWWACRRPCSRRCSVQSDARAVAAGGEELRGSERGDGGPNEATGALAQRPRDAPQENRDAPQGNRRAPKEVRGSHQEARDTRAEPHVRPQAAPRAAAAAARRGSVRASATPRGQPRRASRTTGTGYMCRRASCSAARVYRCQVRPYVLRSNWYA